MSPVFKTVMIYTPEALSVRAASAKAGVTFLLANMLFKHLHSG